MQPLVVFTGQGVARADGFDLTRRVKALADLREAFDTVAWHDRHDLDELIRAGARAGDEPFDRLLAAMRAICLKERRAARRKRTHRDLLALLAECARERLVLHITASVDGLISALAVREFGARWDPHDRTASLDDIAGGVAEAVEQGRGLLHLPVHGEAALIARPKEGFAMRTLFGDPSTLSGEHSWVPTLRLGLGEDVRLLDETFPLARLGYRLLTALALGEKAEIGAGRRARALAPAELLVVGYGAGARPRRAAYPFERAVDSLVRQGAPRPSQRFSALLLDAAASRASARWYSERGFAVTLFARGELGRAARQALLDRPRGALSSLAHPGAPAAPTSVKGSARQEAARPTRRAAPP